MSSTTFDAWKLYKDLILDSLSHKEQVTEAARWKHYIQPELASMPLTEIKTLHIAILRKNLEKRSLKPQTVCHVLSLLRRILRHALEMEMYDAKLPVFRMPKFDNKRQRFLRPDEAENLLALLKMHSTLWHDIALFALQTGLRAGEIFNLKRSHVSFHAQQLTVFDPKNNFTRHVPLNPISSKILEKYLPDEPEGLFFTLRSGKQISQVARIFSKCVKMSGLNNGIADSRNKVVFHTLRHTVASWLIQKGNHLEVVGLLLGHKTLLMTKRYAHLAPNQIHDAVKALSNISAGCDHKTEIACSKNEHQGSHENYFSSLVPPPLTAPHLLSYYYVLNRPAALMEMWPIQKVNHQIRDDIFRTPSESGGVLGEEPPATP